jgi:hypothetical protein
MPAWTTESSVIKHPSDIRDSWLDIQARSECSYFQSWGWIQTWLEQIAIELQPLVVKVQFDGRLVGIGLFVSRDVKRRFFIHSYAMYLNEYPFDGLNMVIEYNGLLAERGLMDEVYLETAGHLSRHYKQYDEFHFGAILDRPDYGILKKCTIGKFKIIENELSECWQVDLEKFAPGLESYLANLSKNSRGQIRRSLRLYGEESPVTLKEAETVTEALKFFELMKGLHMKHWRSKGKAGAYAKPANVNFHRKLIEKRFEFGEVQMIRVANSQRDIAYLLNYVWQHRVYSIQMGFNYDEDKRFKPGYVAHTLAIVHNKDKGMAVYDFMHGYARYKRSLGFSRERLYWVTLQITQLKFFTENLLVSAVRWLRGVS